MVASRPGLDWENPIVETGKGERRGYKLDGVRYIKLIKPFFAEGLPWESYCNLAVEELKEWIHIARPACVIAASNWRTAWPASIAAAESGVPFFYDVRGFWELSRVSSEPEWINSEEFAEEVSQESGVLQKANKIFTINRFMMEELVKRGADREKIGLVPNGVDRVERRREKLSESEALQYPGRILLYAGSFNAYEGLDDLIQGAAQLWHEGIDLSLILLGSSTSSSGMGGLGCLALEGYKKQAAELGFADRLFMPGRVSPERLAAYYEKADVVVIPRRPVPVAEIVSPLKPMEAIFYGKKVLMSNVAPLKELESVSKNFYYFQKGDISSLVTELKNLLSKEEVARPAAPVPDLSSFSWQKCVDPIVAAVESLSMSGAGQVRNSSTAWGCRQPQALPWQFPNRTEQAAAKSHGETDSYFAAAWAALIDRRAGEDPAKRMAPSRRFRPSVILQKSLHTVCQHVLWREVAEDWLECGVTDVWLSHAAESGIRSGSVVPSGALPRIHAWPLYAVNVEDYDRRRGLSIGKNPRSKRYLASFIGAHMSHYISESRLKLQLHAKNPSFYIKSTGDQWHFHGVVWDHQVRGKPVASVYRIDDSVEEYNRVLSDSVFALCPAGAGRNTIRLWEAMAVGAIPVLVDEPPLFPEGGSLPLIDWGKIVLQFSPEDIPNLPLLLRRIPQQEILNRQQRAMAAYRHIRGMTCFPNKKAEA